MRPARGARCIIEGTFAARETCRWHAREAIVSPPPLAMQACAPAYNAGFEVAVRVTAAMAAAVAALGRRTRRGGGAGLPRARPRGADRAPRRRRAGGACMATRAAPMRTYRPGAPRRAAVDCAVAVGLGALGDASTGPATQNAQESATGAQVGLTGAACIVLRRAGLQAKPPIASPRARPASVARSDVHARHRTAPRALEPHGPASEHRARGAAARTVCIEGRLQHGEAGCTAATGPAREGQPGPDPTRRRHVRRPMSPARPSARRRALQLPTVAPSQAAIHNASSTSPATKLPSGGTPAPPHSSRGVRAARPGAAAAHQKGERHEWTGLLRPPIGPAADGRPRRGPRGLMSHSDGVNDDVNSVRPRCANSASTGFRERTAGIIT